MRMYPREFPPGRRNNPRRRAERRVFEALAGAACQGFVYYEWRRGYEHIEMDFAVWIEALGRFALQVKGGRYLLIDGEWYLKTREGLQPVKSCPLDETKLAALDLRRHQRMCAYRLQPVRHSGAGVSGHGARSGHRAVGQAHGGVRDLGGRQPVG